MKMRKRIRYWLRLSGLDQVIDLPAEINSRQGVQLTGKPLGGMTFNNGFLVGYPESGQIFLSDKVYGTSKRHSDYAFDNLSYFLECLELKYDEPMTGLRGRDWDEFPFSHSYPGDAEIVTNDKNTARQVEKFYDYFREKKEGQSLPPLSSASEVRKQKEQAKQEVNLVNRNITLYTVAAIFYPELPEGAVLSKEEVEYPQVILDPTHVLARSREEAQSRVAGKVKEGFIDRQDGQVRWLIQEFQDR